MKASVKTIVASAIFLAMQHMAHAGLIVTALDQGITPTDLVNELLAGSSGITASNINYTGAQVASGTFTGGAGILDSANPGANFGSGLVLTSGDAHNVIGPNNSTLTTTANGTAGNATLNGLIPGYSTLDAAVLTFDFVPTGNFVTFKYVFGSEEYNEWVNSAYNDVFGFFINGVNYALIPGTTTPVSINNVNCGYASGANAAPGTGTNCGHYINNTNPNYSGLLDTQLDGLTTVLSLVAPVISGATNTMFIGIADAGDQNLDSAVFLQAGSFSVCGQPGQPACPTPEPVSSSLLGLGLVAMAAMRRRKFI